MSPRLPTGRILLKFKERRDNTRNQLKEKMQRLDKKISTSEGKMKEKLKEHRQKLGEKFDKWDEELAWEVI